MESLSPYWPAQDDVDHFVACGWVTSPPFIPESLLEEAAEAIEAYYLGERDHPLPVSGFLDWHPGDGEGLRLNDYVSLQSDGLRKMVCWSQIARAAAALAQVASVRLFHDQLITKAPLAAGDSTAVGWHTDKAYWATCTSDRMLTAWIPLEDCSEAAGPLAMIDGSHTWEGTDWMRTFTSRDFGAIEARLGRPIHPRPLLLKRGQLSFHHGATIHGSLPNRSTRPRSALTIHFQDAANAYKPSASASVHMNDVLCRRLPNGHPDYADSHVCPTLWPPSAAGAPERR